MEEIIRRQKVNFFKSNVLQPRDACEKVASFYLSEAEWSLEEAEKAY
jgi:hypothetical protein